ncbi:hypothetical protein GGR58DRAFT_517308 [Xylaria digitata]|nr:hypothetical protein GGR58DRAFT_517308 [Xylaria digitata]
MEKASKRLGCCGGCVGLVLFAPLLKCLGQLAHPRTHPTPPPNPQVRLRHDLFPRGIGIGLSACHVYHYFFRGYFSSLTSMTTEPALSNILPEQIFETALHWWSCRMQHIIDRKFPKGATLNRLDSNTVKLPLTYAI